MKYSHQEIYQMREYLHRISEFSHIQIECAPTKIKYSHQEIYQMREYLHKILKFSHIKIDCAPTKIKYSHQEIYQIREYLHKISEFSHIKIECAPTKIKYSHQEIYYMREYLHQILKFSHVKKECAPTKIKYSHQEIYQMREYLHQILKFSHVKIEWAPTNQDWTHEIFTQEIYQMTEYLHEILKFPYIIKIGHIQFSLWRNQNNHIHDDQFFDNFNRIYCITKYLHQMVNCSHHNRIWPTNEIFTLEIRSRAIGHNRQRTSTVEKEAEHGLWIVKIIIMIKLDMSRFWNVKSKLLKRIPKMPFCWNVIHVLQISTNICKFDIDLPPRSTSLCAVIKFTGGSRKSAGKD